MDQSIKLVFNPYCCIIGSLSTYRSYAGRMARLLAKTKPIVHNEFSVLIKALVSRAMCRSYPSRSP